MGLFGEKVAYGKQWIEDLQQRHPFNKQQLDAINEIEVVASNYGTSARLDTNDGYYYFPLDKDSQRVAPVGTLLDKSRCFVCLFRREGKTCEKIHYDAPSGQDENLPF